MKRLTNPTCRSDAYAEWTFTIYPFAASATGVLWLCRIDLVGESPQQILDCGYTPLAAFTGALSLVVKAREIFDWNRRN
jgi:hypothetical protein